MKWIVSPVLVSVLALPVSAGEIDAKAALGGALGGATGAALGSSASSQHKTQPPPTRVIHRYPQHQHDQGLHLGHYKRKHKHRDDD